MAGRQMLTALIMIIVCSPWLNGVVWSQRCGWLHMREAQARSTPHHHSAVLGGQYLVIVHPDLVQGQHCLLSTSPFLFIAFPNVCHCPTIKRRHFNILEVLDLQLLTLMNVGISICWVSLLHSYLVLRLRWRIKLCPRMSVIIRVGVMITMSTVCLTHTSARCSTPNICTVSWSVLLLRV